MTGTISMAAIYGFVALLSLLIAIGYCGFVREKLMTLLLIHFSVFIVNLGYFLLAISKSLEEALLANRIAYLGSVFLPMFMLMTIMNVCEIRGNIFLKSILLIVSIATFLLAASGGYLDVYYKEVSLEFVNGAARLVKEYGPLHSLYFVYLLSYFGLMVGVIIYAMIKKRGNSHTLAVFLAAIVLGNVGIWFVEQLIRVDFEFLSVSYVVMELLITLVYSMEQENASKIATAAELCKENVVELKPVGEKDVISIPLQNKESLKKDLKNDKPNETELLKENITEKILCDSKSEKVEDYENELELKKQSWELSCPDVSKLTERELEVLMLIMENKKRKDIATELNVSENTVKKHTSHIFSKIGVTNRTELFEKIK